VSKLNVDDELAGQRGWLQRFNRPENRQIARLVILAGVLVFVLWLGIKAWRIGRVVRALPVYEERVTALTANGLASADPVEADALVMDLRRDVVTLRRELKPFLPLASLFTWLPRVGPLLAETRPLLDMADYGSEAAAYAMRGLGPALAVVQEQEGGSTVTRVIPLLAAAEPDLRRASTALERVVAARAEIEEPAALPWRVRTLLERLDEKLYLASIFDLLVVAPRLLGHDEPQIYLLVAQNEDEVRATGGFITGAGLLIVDHGDVRDLQFQDANVIDAWEGSGLAKPYELAPEPLWQLMGVQLWLFRDANFSPDFPTAAQKMMALYSYGQDYPALDGVIAIDQQFLALLLENTGPLNIADLQMTVTAANLAESLQAAWQTADEGESTTEWILSRKDFLGPMAAALKDKLLSDIASLDLIFLAHNINRALEEKHLQIYVTDPSVGDVLEENGWSNRVAGEPGRDLLMVVDSNVGYNKVAPFIRSSLSYEILLDDTGTAEAIATATYTHMLQSEIACRQGGQVAYSSLPSYQELAVDCFWNYARLYVPAGSELLQATRHPYDPALFTLSEGWSAGPEATSDLDGLALFHNFFILAPGETVDSVYRYSLPEVTRSENGHQVYELRLVRQAGAAPRAFSVEITLPPGARLQEVSPLPASHTGNTLQFSDELRTDVAIRIVYDMPET
jgi:hypothetical protein